MRGAKHIVLTIAFLLAVGSNLHAQSRIPWITNWQEASTLAQRYQRLVLIHFWSNNCPPCMKLERTVFNRPEVIRAIVSNYVPLKINVDQNPEWVRHFRVQQWPTDVVVTEQGAVVYRGTSPQDPNRFIATLDQVAAHARIGAPFSGSPSTDIAAESRDSNLLNRASAFPVSTSTNASMGNPIPSAAATPYRGLAPQPSPSGPATNQVPHSQQNFRPSSSTAPPTAGRSFAPTPNAFATPPAMPSAPTHEEQASFNASNAAQGLPASSIPPFGTGPSPQPATNPFVTAAMPGSGEMPHDVPSHAPRSGHQQMSAQQAPSQQAPSQQNPPSSGAPALNGYCGVTLVEQEKWVKGDPRWGVEHRGRIYLFAGPEEQRRFLANFDRYAPALSGFDCVKYAEQGALVDGRRAHGIFYRGRIFLFADEAALKIFWNAPQRYVPVVEAEEERYAARH